VEEAHSVHHLHLISSCYDAVTEWDESTGGICAGKRQHGSPGGVWFRIPSSSTSAISRLFDWGIFVLQLGFRRSFFL